MKDNYQALEQFIMAQKDFFETALLPDVNMGVTNLDAIYSWETNVWRYAQASQGFLAKALTTINFHEINSDRLGGLFKSDDKSFKTLIINQIYVDFMKAYCVSLYQGSNPSGAMVYAHQMLLKRVYVRMVMSGIETHPANITSELLQQATDMLAQSRTGNTAITNASKDYDDANVIAKQLNYLGITLTPLEIKKKQKGMATNTTTAGKIAKKAEFGEDLDQDEREKNLSIQTFLNVVTLRGIVQHDGERIVLNLVLLLMVTGFRHMEAAALRYNSFKVVEIEDHATKILMEQRGLPIFYVGIVYLGEKGAGHRTHWLEPLAVDIVEELWVDTIVLTEKLRAQIEYVRETGFESYLPKVWRTRSANVVEMNEPLVNLDDIVDEVYESYSATSSTGGRCFLRDKATKKIKNSGLGIKPHSVIKLGRHNAKDIRYTQSDMERFIHHTIENNTRISNDFIYRTTDAKTKVGNNIPYEDLLFIIPEGSGATKRTGAMKVVPQVIDKFVLSPFLGYGSEANRERSIFAKYGLTDENGEITMMYSHTPRHGINTFIAIAGVSDHIQAMFMGRQDLTQNEHYHHLAITERAISTELITVSNPDSHFKHETTLERIKTEGQIGFNLKLTPANALAQAMNTHTTTQDKAAFVVDVVNNSNSSAFSEFDDIFYMLAEKEKEETAARHTDLNPMDIGSCRRKLATFQCPYNMKCQDGTPCPYFTLTGRDGELLKVEQLAASIESEITIINQMEITGHMAVAEADEILATLNLRKEHIQYHLGQSRAFEDEKVQINLLELDNMKKPKMLSSIFALEHRKLEKAKAL
ncbi:hypothetical protein [Vibrio cholerae]|uniref:hypothetical protein n=1 Tax=Vibrio cholerae TaxID=666 RepID=UPI0010FF5E92|nr:hypothetical protein [Vibrio cholerae]EGR1702084.1 hypothetical protein [Vibrio cholerae]EGR4188424.1 hypothetical protein [Vibrio cholerae]ELY5193198.1 hypothetical protein [Vibrio cholerae]TLE24026.1 hypothetical protein D2924_04480 [Vibrio cholerae]TLE36260.1 hypothetical protein D2925_03655 [Vibrio cholerae]